MIAVFRSRPFNSAVVPTEAMLLIAFMAEVLAVGSIALTTLLEYAPIAEDAKLIPNTLAKLLLLTVPVAAAANVEAVVFTIIEDTCFAVKPVADAISAIV